MPKRKNIANTLVITGKEPVATKVLKGHINQVPSLRTTHEEADIIMV